jgi:sterol desaturase/sphingolipid hydroxylase (fatty acid hydroxylase superfamily)
MSREPTSRDVPSIRLFESSALEFFTHVHPAVVPIVWVPVALYHLSCAIAAAPPAGLSAGRLTLAVALGIVAWSLVEYAMHRFVFHFATEHSPAWLARASFMIHGVHHAQPWDKTRLVMPPVVSVPLAFGFYGLFQLVAGRGIGAPAWVDPLFSGFVAAYVAYDLLHYAIHHRPMRWGPLARLKRYHLLHHYVTPGDRFGVSSPAWDRAFRTLPPA